MRRSSLSELGWQKKKLIGHVWVLTRESFLNQRTSSPRRIRTIHSSRSRNRTEDRLFLSTRSRPNAMTAKKKTFWEYTHAQQRQIPLEWDQLTGNASGERRQIQLGGKYKSIRNENGWQELECTWRDTGWWIENCHKRNHNKIADFEQKTVSWIFWRGLHRHFKNFTFHFFSKSFLRKKILYQTLQFNLSRNFICGDRQMDKHALPGIEHRVTHLF